MKKLSVAAVLGFCLVALAATPTAGSAPITPSTSVAATGCNALPTSYRSNPAKTGLWLGSCLVAKKLGPRQMARNLRLSSSSPSFVARQYATRYVQTPGFQALASRVGGKAAGKTIVYNGVLAGFRARGRP